MASFLGRGRGKGRTVAWAEIWRMATGTLGIPLFPPFPWASGTLLVPNLLCLYSRVHECIPKGTKERKTPIFCYHLVLSHIFPSQCKFNILPTGLTYADLTHDLSKTLFNLHHLKSWLKKMQGQSKRCLVALSLKAGVGPGLVLQFIDLDLVWSISLRTIGYQAWLMINKVDDTDFVCPRKHLPQTLGECSHPSSSTWSQTGSIILFHPWGIPHKWAANPHLNNRRRILGFSLLKLEK